MAKFLFVVPPFFGHVSPTISIGTSLIEKGHEVVWTGLIPIKDEHFPEKGRYILPQKDLEEHQAEIDRILKMQDEGPNLSVLEAALLAMEGTAIPFAKIMMKGVNNVIDEFRPDIIVNDCLALAGALAAYKRGIPYVTTIPVPPDVMGNPDTSSKILEWHIKKIIDLQKSLDISSEEMLIYSNELCLIFTSQEFAAMKNIPPYAKFVGPLLGRFNDVPFDWERLSKATTPKIYVTIGTLLVDIRKEFFGKLIEAFKDKPVTIVAATDPALFDEWPDNFIVQGFVPQAAIIKQMDAVICHGGFNSVNDTFMNGLPMLIIPIAYDHFHTANLIEKAGCGISLKYKRLRVNNIWDAMSELLSNPKYRDAAKKVRQSFIDAGGNKKAVEYLEAFYESKKEKAI